MCCVVEIGCDKVPMKFWWGCGDSEFGRRCRLTYGGAEVAFFAKLRRLCFCEDLLAVFLSVFCNEKLHIHVVSIID